MGTGGMLEAQTDHRRPGDRPTPWISETDWLPALLVALVTAYVALWRPGAERLTDLQVYLGAVDGLRHGASLYDFIRVDAPFTYPPLAGLLFLPLTCVPVPVVQAAWTLATVGAVIMLARLIAPRNAAVLALILMLSAPVSSNLKFGQVSLLLAVLVLRDVQHTGRAQGVLVGLAAAIKLTPLIFVPMLWFGGRRRAAVTAAVTFGAGGLLAAAALPSDSWRYWLTEVRDVHRLGAITSVGNQSLNGALLRLGLATPVRTGVVLLIGGLVVGLALRRAARLSRAGDWGAACVVVGAAAVVFSPVSWTHHQVWLVLAVFLPTPRIFRGVALALMVLPVTALDGPLAGNARLLLAITIAVALPITARDPAEHRGGEPVRRTSVGEVSRDRHQRQPQN